MDKQQIAAELTKMVPWLVRVGSLDDLEAFRREKLPEWVYWDASSNGPTALRPFIFELSASASRSVKAHGPDEWTARALALLSAVAGLGGAE